MNDQDFEVPVETLSPGVTIRLLVEVIGTSDAIASQEIRVEPGLVIHWQIENALSHSSLSYFFR
jgi:hypothetical protein